MSNAENYAAAALVLKAFNGGIVHVPDPSNPRGYCSHYRPLEAMKAALASHPAQSGDGGRTR